MLLKAIKLARKEGFRYAKRWGTWNGYKVYEPMMFLTKMAYIGHPKLILINEKKEVRWASSSEVGEILFNDSDWHKAIPESTEQVETQTQNIIEENAVKTDNNYEKFSNRQSAIDAYIAKFGEYPFMSLSDLKDEFVISLVETAFKTGKEIPLAFANKDNSNIQINDPDINKIIETIDNKIVEINSQQQDASLIIENNLNEINKYSILDKTIDELNASKKKFIDDWYYMLINSNDKYWPLNSSTYRIRISGIIDSILRKNSSDEKCIKQKEFLNQAIECLKEKNLDRLISIVLEIKNIENNK